MSAALASLTLALSAATGVSSRLRVRSSPLMLCACPHFHAQAAHVVLSLDLTGFLRCRLLCAQATSMRVLTS